MKGIVTYPPHRVDSVQHTVCSIVDNKGRVLLSRIPHTGWTQSNTQSAALWTTREGYRCHLSHTQGVNSVQHTVCSTADNTSERYCCHLSHTQGVNSVQHTVCSTADNTSERYCCHLSHTQGVNSVQHTVCSIVDNLGKKNTTVSSSVLNLSLKNDAELKTGIPE